MKHSKLFSLVQHLPEKETALLAKNIKTHKRDTIQKLFATLIKSKKEDEPLPEEVFKTVFGKKYTKSSDYLLRNEYRLLYDWLQEQILSNFLADKKTDITIFLQYLLQLKAFELFEEEYHAAWKKAIQQDDIDLLVRLSDLNLTYYLTAKPQSLAHAELMTDLSQQRLGLLQTQFLRSIRKEEIRLKLSERIISAYKQLPNSSVALENVSLVEVEKTDLYAQYLSQRAKINFARGEEKIELLQAILANEPIVRKYEPAPEEALCRFLINLAQEYYLLMHFQKSVSYYQKAYAHFNQVSGPVQETLILNYIMSLMRQGDFKTAEQLATSNAELMLNSKILASRAPFLLAVLNLYARNAAAAERYVNLDSKKDGSEFYYFMRLVLSAVYYLEGKFDLALRESINLDQAVNYELNRDKNLQTQISKPIVSTFRKFYTILQSRSSSTKKDLKKLQEEISNLLQSKTDQSPNSMLIDWLLIEINYLS